MTPDPTIPATRGTLTLTGVHSVTRNGKPYGRAVNATCSCGLCDGVTYTFGLSDWRKKHGDAMCIRAAKLKSRRYHSERMTPFKSTPTMIYAPRGR